MAQLGEIIAQTGDSVRLEAEFKNFAGEFADPTGMSVKVYVRSTRQNLVTGSPTKSSVGHYYYYYTVPVDDYGALAYEFSGTLDSLPVVVRKLLLVEWV